MQPMCVAQGGFPRVRPGRGLSSWVLGVLVVGFEQPARRSRNLNKSSSGES